MKKDDKMPMQGLMSPAMMKTMKPKETDMAKKQGKSGKGKGGKKGC
jgi:hypothetical protein